MNTFHFTEPLPWYVAGPALGLCILLYVIFLKYPFGMSSSYDHFLSIIPGFDNGLRVPYQLSFAIGLAFAGYLWALFFPDKLQAVMTQNFGSVSNPYQREDVLFVSGLLVGVGARYARGCTAGHCMMGVAQGSFASLVSTVFFFVGGLILVYFLN